MGEGFGNAGDLGLAGLLDSRFAAGAGDLAGDLAGLFDGFFDGCPPLRLFQCCITACALRPVFSAFATSGQVIFSSFDMIFDRAASSSSVQRGTFASPLTPLWRRGLDGGGEVLFRGMISSLTGTREGVNRT